jgi:integrase
MEIVGALRKNTFDWLDYWKPDVSPQVKITAAKWIEKFKEDFFRDRDSPSLRETWRGHFQMAYKHLPQDEELTAECLIDCLKLQSPESRSRQIYYKALTRLVKFAELGIDLSKYKGDYSAKELNVRDIPEDEQIQKLILGIKDPEWKYVFALMAIFGLRPHECWLCDLELPNVYVHEKTKTGRRLVFPVPLIWIEMFEIKDGVAPKVTVQSNSDYGNRACKFARKNGLPVPYTFRHAYALRNIHAGVPDTIAAAWMGHDLTVHNRSYQRWLSKRDHLKVFNSINNNNNA